MVGAKVCFAFALLSGVNAAGDWINGRICFLGTTCDNCENEATWWGVEAFTACGPEPGDLASCTADMDTELAAACKCGASDNNCGIGHYCYDDACHRVAKSEACTTDAYTAISGAACKCGGSFLKDITGLAPECAVGQYCYDGACSDAAKVVVTPEIPAVVPVAPAVVPAEVASPPAKEDEGWSTTQWVLLGCGIALLVGCLAIGIGLMMGCCEKSKKRSVKSSKKRAMKTAPAPAPVVEEQQPLFQEQPQVFYAAPQVNYAAPPMTYIQQAPMYSAPAQTYAAPAQPVSYMQAPTYAAPAMAQTYQQAVPTYLPQYAQAP